MPLTYASILGKCALSICFFGDSRQMPPIFRKELENNVLSQSILDYCATKVAGVPVCVLPETYRMNGDITKLVSETFYEPYGISLNSAASVKGNQFQSTYLSQKGLDNSIIFMDDSISTPNCQEENEGEADAIIELVKTLLDEGNKHTNMAVITPYRKQVRLLRAKAQEVIDMNECPLIDTVERLQGQDVDCIIISFASSDEDYIKSVYDFIFNRNRLNVMISRAKTKVLIFGCNFIQKELKEKIFLN
jgi:superfamily I DNA and/or RNA helicase